MDQVDRKDLVHQWSHLDRENHPFQAPLVAPWDQLDQKDLANQQVRLGLEDLEDLEHHRDHLFPNGDKQ